LKKAAELQAKNPKATFGVTKFSDLTEEEHKKFYRMANTDFSQFPKFPTKTQFNASRPQLSCSPDPTNYDWFADCSGSCTPVYNQGQCGSCWAFSATETIESYYALDTQNSIVQLSMEQIVDCDTAGQDQGCNGGFPTGAYQYVQSAGGLDSYANYPYTAEGGNSGTCQSSSYKPVATVSSYSSINGETGLYQQLSSASGGPVSVCVDASAWSSYTGGILTQCTDNVDHCVQATGYANYGQSGSYWIVRNSWGTDWGEQGFIWVEIGQDLCAIGDYATVVVAASA
jgi:cysteine peptidase B